MSDSPGPEHRCCAHLALIRVLKEHCAEFCFPDDLALLIDTKREIAALRDCKRWDKAWMVAKVLIERFPDEEEYVNLAADLQLSATMERLIGEDSETSSTHDVEKIQEGITGLDTLRDHSPYNLLVLDLLAELHHIRAVKLANAGKLSSALLEVEMAVAFNPGPEKLWESREQIIKMMNDLRESMQKLLEEIKAVPNATLNIKGMQMKIEVDTGFSLMNAFAESELPAQLQEARQKASALAIWKEIGLEKVTVEIHAHSDCTPCLAKSSDRKGDPSRRSEITGRRPLVMTLCFPH